MAKYEWIPGQVPDGMKITQVYCIMFDRQGRVMLLLEEVNTEIETPVGIGYQLADEENGTPAYAQIRMAAMIRSIGEKRPDPDNGEIYDRYMTTPEKAAMLLNWGDVGYQQVMAAKDVIYSQYGIGAVSEAGEWV